MCVYFCWVIPPTFTTLPSYLLKLALISHYGIPLFGQVLLCSCQLQLMTWLSLCLVVTCMEHTTHTTALQADLSHLVFHFPFHVLSSPLLVFTSFEAPTTKLFHLDVDVFFSPLSSFHKSCFGSFLKVQFIIIAQISITDILVNSRSGLHDSNHTRFPMSFFSDNNYNHRNILCEPMFCCLEAIISHYLWWCTGAFT